MKIANVALLLLGGWLFFSGGNLDGRVLASGYLYGVLLFILVCFLVTVFFKGVRLHIAVLIFPALFLYMWLVGLFFGAPLSGVIKVIVFSLVVMMASYLASRIEIEEFLKTLVISLFLLLLVNTFVAVFYPEVGLEVGKFSGDWKGIYDQKNSLGRLASLLMVSSVLLLACSRDSGVKLYSVLILVSAVLVGLNAGSRTGLATGGLVIVFVIAFSLVSYIVKSDYKHKKTFLVVVFLEAVLLFLLIVMNAEIIDLYSGDDGVSFFGHFVSLTGRLTIWEFVLGHLSGIHAWVGYGLDNFWTYERFSVIGPMQGMGDFYPEDSHNGYIDLLVQGGVVAVSIYLALAVLIVVAMFSARLNARERLCVFAFLMLFVISNLTESYTTKSTNVISFLFVYFVSFLLLRSSLFGSKAIMEIKPYQYLGSVHLQGVAKK